MSTIGFAGLGNMGAPMAANLAAAGHTVRGYDVVDVAVAGVEVVDGLAAVARGADVVVTMLPSGALVAECYDTLLEAAARGTLFVDSSTIGVFEARALQDRARAAGHAAIDAPVSGGVVGAEAGSLTFMAGGDEADVARATPVLEAMGKRVVHCGGGGNGQAAKACNNLVLAISMIGVAEAFALGERLGLSHEAFFDVGSTSTASCWALNANCPVPGPVPTSPANRDFEGGFASALMVKDLHLAQEAARGAGAATELGAHATAIYEAVLEAGRGGEDFSTVINRVREASA